MKYIFLVFALSVFLPMIFRLIRFSLNPTKRATPVIEYAEKKGYRLVNPSATQIPAVPS